MDDILHGSLPRFPEVPVTRKIPHRVDAVLRTVYLVFNEGYAASAGSTLMRTDLTGEAIRLGRLLVELLPDPETYGLLALMLLQDSRRQARGTVGGYTVQASIAAEHAGATDYAATRWDRIVSLYDLLLQIEPTPVVELNRAVAIGMRDSAEEGLHLVEELLARGDLDGFHLLHAARADLQRRAGLSGEARLSYRRALELAGQEPERRFLLRRLRELG